MRWPLRYQILLPLVAVVLAMLAGLSVLSFWLAGSRAQAQIQQQMSVVARTLEESNFPLSGLVLRHTAGLSGAELVVSEPGGEVVASSDESLTPIPSSSAVQRWQELSLEQSVEIGKRRFFYGVVKLDRSKTGGGLVHLHILYPEQSWRDARDQALYPPLIIGGAALLVLVVLAVAIAARVTRPIGRLRGQVERIAEGRFEPLPVPTRDDEIRDLAVAVNRMAEMLARYEDEVRRNERLKTLGQLGGGIAHQMRNAATGCRMALDLHQRHCPLPDDEDIDVAARQLALMEKYLQRFLTLGRPSDAEPRSVELGSLVDSLIPLIRPSANHVEVSLEYEMPERPLTVSGDADRLEQLLVNLLLNAVEAAAARRGGRVIVRLCAAGDRDVRLEVLDSGTGPAAEAGQRIYDPLYTDKPDGTGLGLTVAREIAQQHGGSMSWQRRDNMTCFAVDLPLETTETLHGAPTGR